MAAPGGAAPAAPAPVPLQNLDPDPNALLTVYLSGVAQGEALEAMSDRLAETLLDDPSDGQARALLGRVTLAQVALADRMGALWATFEAMGGSLADYYRAVRA